jgi:hypothetical protein
VNSPEIEVMEKTFQELAAQHQKCSAVRKVEREKAPLSRFGAFSPNASIVGL